MINTISPLLINDACIDSPPLICNTIEKYFFSLFNKPSCPAISFNWDLLLPKKISHPSNLEVQFPEEEIKRSVFALPREKFPCPDGFHLCFYQHFWDDIKRDVFDMFKLFHQSDDVNTLQSIN